MSYQGKTGSPKGHNTLKKPVGLWQLDNSLADSSGNGRDLVLNVGTSNYCQFLPNFNGFFFNGSTILNRGGTFDAALGITGDMTVEAVCSYSSGNRFFIFSGVGETSDVNCLWSLGTTDLTNFNGIDVFHEHGSGVDDTFDLADSFPLYTPVHLALVRRANKYSVYFNGFQIGVTSNTLTAPDGGTNSQLWVGGFNGGSFWNGVMASLIVYDRALSPSEVAQDYNLCLGSTFGFRP